MLNHGCGHRSQLSTPSTLGHYAAERFPEGSHSAGRKGVHPEILRETHLGRGGGHSGL